MCSKIFSHSYNWEIVYSYDTIYPRGIKMSVHSTKLPPFLFIPLPRGHYCVQFLWSNSIHLQVCFVMEAPWPSSQLVTQSSLVSTHCFIVLDLSQLKAQFEGHGDQLALKEGRDSLWWEAMTHLLQGSPWRKQSHDRRGEAVGTGPGVSQD